MNPFVQLAQITFNNSEQERVILLRSGFGDRFGLYNEVCEFFKAIFNPCNPILKSGLSKTIEIIRPPFWIKT